MKKIKIGILCIQGLPARYGAFEQTANQIVHESNRASNGIEFYVGCSNMLRNFEYKEPNVTRIFTPRYAGLSVILYNLINFIKMYTMGVRNYIVFGYGISPFFPMLRLAGVKIVCNVDGFEWRREKWSKLIQRYFKFCEIMAARFSSKLIFDSVCIGRYYRRWYRVRGDLAFYGSETFNDKEIVKIPEQISNFQYFVVVMRLEPENNIFNIVKGFLNSKSNHKLVIIGPSTKYFKDSVQPLIEESNRIIWLGPIYDRALLWSIRSASVGYIHGHSVGGTNPTLVEACMIGRPIIAFNSTFNREVLGKNSLYFRTNEDLTYSLNNFELFKKDPPQLNANYEWSNIANIYINQFKG